MDHDEAIVLYVCFVVGGKRTWEWIYIYVYEYFNPRNGRLRVVSTLMLIIYAYGLHTTAAIHSPAKQNGPKCSRTDRIDLFTLSDGHICTMEILRFKSISKINVKHTFKPLKIIDQNQKFYRNSKYIRR